MKLVSIEQVKDHKEILFKLLLERPTEANISHAEMPTFERHVAFVKSSPYKAWYLIECETDTGHVFVGSIYLTRNDEIGIALFEKWWSLGLAEDAIDILMRWWGPRRYLANIAPGNERSINFFAKLGFRHVQNTYVFTPLAAHA